MASMTGATNDTGLTHRCDQTNAVDLFDEVPLSEAEYVEVARAANTLRGHRSDWAEFTGWCTNRGGDRLNGLEPLDCRPL